MRYPHRHRCKKQGKTAQVSPVCRFDFRKQQQFTDRKVHTFIQNRAQLFEPRCAVEPVLLGLMCLFLSLHADEITGARDLSCRVYVRHDPWAPTGKTCLYGCTQVKFQKSTTYFLLYWYLLLVNNCWCDMHSMSYFSSLLPTWLAVPTFRLLES